MSNYDDNWLVNSRSLLLGNSHELVLSEIKDAYNKQLELKETLDRKAQTNIQIAGIIITLLFGFSAFIFTIFGQAFENKIQVLELIVLSMIFNLASVLMAVRTLKLRDFQFMFSDLGQGKLKEYISSTKFVAINSLIDDYDNTNRHNIRENRKKANLLRISQETMFIGILIIPIVIVAFILIKS
jgi:hypothetical protein